MTIKKHIFLFILLVFNYACVTNHTPFDPKNSTFRIITEENSKGSSFYIGTDEKLFVTSAHCIVDNNGRVLKTYIDEKKIEVVYINIDKDLALFKCKELQVFQSFNINTKKNMLGDTVYSIGYHLGIEFSIVSKGFISDHNDYSGKFIITSVPVNSGCSGGPLLNSDMEVIGINSMILSKLGVWDGVSLHTRAYDIELAIAHYNILKLRYGNNLYILYKDKIHENSL